MFCYFERYHFQHIILWVRSMDPKSQICTLAHELSFIKSENHIQKFSDKSMSISINLRIQKNLYDLTERCEYHDDDESDKHLEARDRRYSCLTFQNRQYQSLLITGHLMDACNTTLACLACFKPSIFKNPQ